MTTWLNILPIFNGPRLVVAERAEHVASALALYLASASDSAVLPASTVRPRTGGGYTLMSSDDLPLFTSTW